MIDQIDDILFYLRDSDSKKPMQAEKLAAKLEVSMPRFEEMMNIICNIVPAPVNRAYREVTENIEKNIKAFKGYVYWPTGVIDKAHWKDFKPASSKPAAQPIRTENSIQKVSADTYETPVFGQTTTTDAPAAPDYSDKPKAYQILKYIEAHPGCSSKPIEKLLRLKAAIRPYILGYLDRGEVIQFEDDLGVTFKVSKPVDEFYHHRKVVEKKQQGEPKNEVTPIPQQPEETTAQSVLDAQAPAAEPVRVAMPEVQENATQNHQDEVVHDHPSDSVRFAFTNDKCLLLLGIQYVPICFSASQTKELFDFMYSVGMEPDL